MATDDLEDDDDTRPLRMELAELEEPLHRFLRGGSGSVEEAHHALERLEAALWHALEVLGRSRPDFVARVSHPADLPLHPAAAAVDRTDPGEPLEIDRSAPAHDLTGSDELLRDAIARGFTVASSARLVLGLPTQSWMGYYQLSVALGYLRATSKTRQMDLAEILGTSKAQISHLETNRRGRRPPVETLFRWVEACGWHLEWRLRPKGEPQPSPEAAALIAEVERLAPRLDETSVRRLRRIVAAFDEPDDGNW